MISIDGLISFKIFANVRFVCACVRVPGVATVKPPYLEYFQYLGFLLLDLGITCILCTKYLHLFSVRLSFECFRLKPLKLVSFMLVFDSGRHCLTDTIFYNKQ